MDSLRSAGPQAHFSRRAVLLTLLGALFACWMVFIPRLGSLAAAELTIEPVTWNVIGLDPTNINGSPNVFPVAARVCNIGDTTANDVVSTFIWDNANPAINLLGPGSLTVLAIAPAECVDFTYRVQITRNAASLNTARNYRISATAQGLGSIVYTPAARQVYVQSLTSQGNLAINSLAGPAALEVGLTYTYTLSATTGNANYGQIEHFIDFPNSGFLVKGVDALYANPPGTTGDQPYLDACGWVNDPADPNYLDCASPAQVISGTLLVTYTVEILAEGTYTLTAGLYGYTNLAFVYSPDFGQDSLSVSAQLVIDESSYLPIVIKNQPKTPTVTPTATSTGTSTATPTITGTPYTHTPTLTGTQPTHTPTPSPTVTGTPPTSTPTLTGTPPTPTSTGSITPNPGATKAVSPVEAGIGQNFTFTIRVTNNGSAPATNVVLNDSFSAYTYLDIFDLTTSKGTKNITGRNVTITIGTVNPGEVVTVRIIIRVNSTAPTTAQPCNVARITYSTSGSRQSNTQCFRVRGGSSLPPTGELAIEPAEPVLPWAALAFLVTLGLGGMILLRVALAVWKSQPRQARWLLGSGVLVTGLALFSGLAAMGTFNRETTPNPQIGMTSEALTVLTATPSVTTNPLARLPAYMFATPDPDEPLVIETLPSFPIPTPSITITPGVEDSGPDTSAAVRMVIPRMDLDARVAYVPFNGQTWLIQGLREEIAWLGNTSWPGLGGNTGFAAHVTVRGLGNGPFRFLNELSPGDEIRVYTERQIYTYRVRELRIVEETDLWVTDPSENPQITLITCVDWNENIGIYLKRLIVIADQVGLAPLASR